MRAPRLLLILLLAVPSFGCRTARMPVPGSLAGAERLAVEGRQGSRIRERLRFGPFEAADVRRSWTTGSDLEVLRYEGNRRVQQYTFTLREGAADRVDVACHAFLRVRTGHMPVVDVEFENRSELDCTFQTAGSPPEALSMSLRARDERPLSGELAGNDLALQIRGTDRLDGALSPGTTTGYEILDQNDAVGAVEVVNDGAVWLSADVPSALRPVLAAAAAGLLLLEDLRVHL